MRAGGDSLLPSKRSPAIRLRTGVCGLVAARASAVPRKNGRRELVQGREARGRARAGARFAGGMMVTVGSRRIEASIRGRFARLRNAMREVG